MRRKRALVDGGVSLDHIGISAKRAPSPPTTPRAMRRIYRRVCKQHTQCIDEAQKVLMMAAAADEPAKNATVVQFLEVRLTSIAEQVEDLREILSSPRRHLRRSPRKHAGLIVSPRGAIQTGGASLSDTECNY